MNNNCRYIYLNNLSAFDFIQQSTGFCVFILSRLLSKLNVKIIEPFRKKREYFFSAIIFELIYNQHNGIGRYSLSNAWSVNRKLVPFKRHMSVCVCARAQFHVILSWQTHRQIINVCLYVWIWGCNIIWGYKLKS